MRTFSSLGEAVGKQMFSAVKKVFGIFVTSLAVSPYLEEILNPKAPFCGRCLVFCETFGLFYGYLSPCPCSVTYCSWSVTAASVYTAFVSTDFTVLTTGADKLLPGSLNLFLALFLKELRIYFSGARIKFRKTCFGDGATVLHYFQIQHQSQNYSHRFFWGGKCILTWTL